MTFGGGGSVMKNQYRGGLLGGLGQFAHLTGGGTGLARDTEIPGWCPANDGYPLDIQILGWCPAGPLLPHGEKVSL